VGGYFGFDVGNATRVVEFRIQRDNADEPAGQTTANYQFRGGGDATDELGVLTQCIPSLTASTAYTFDLDASSDSTTGTPAGQHTSLWAVTMELAVAGAQSVVPVVARQYRQRRI
jgi:phage-related tail fiber protein